MQDRRLHMAVPVLREGNSRESLFRGHNGLRIESLLLDSEATINAVYSRDSGWTVSPQIRWTRIDAKSLNFVWD